MNRQEINKSIEEMKKRILEIELEKQIIIDNYYANERQKINEAVNMEMTMQRILQLQRYFDYDRKRTSESFKRAIEEYETKQLQLES